MASIKTALNYILLHNTILSLLSLNSLPIPVFKIPNLAKIIRISTCSSGPLSIAEMEAAGVKVEISFNKTVPSPFRQPCRTISLLFLKPTI